MTTMHEELKRKDAVSSFLFIETKNNRDEVYDSLCTIPGCISEDQCGSSWINAQRGVCVMGNGKLCAQGCSNASTGAADAPVCRQQGMGAHPNVQGAVRG